MVITGATVSAPGEAIAVDAGAETPGRASAHFADRARRVTHGRRDFQRGPWRFRLCAQVSQRIACIVKEVPLPFRNLIVIQFRKLKGIAPHRPEGVGIEEAIVG